MLPAERAVLHDRVSECINISAENRHHLGVEHLLPSAVLEEAGQISYVLKISASFARECWKDLN